MSTYIMELDKILLIYRVIIFIDKTNNNEVDLVTPQRKIRYNIHKDIYRDNLNFNSLKYKMKKK